MAKAFVPCDVMQSGQKKPWKVVCDPDGSTTDPVARIQPSGTEEGESIAVFAVSQLSQVIVAD